MNTKQKQLQFLLKEEEIEKKRKLETESKPERKKLDPNSINLNNAPKIRKNIASQQKKILLFLTREKPRKYSTEQIALETKVNIDGPLQLALRDNPRIRIENEYYSFKPLKTVQNRQELETVISKDYPISKEDLSNSYEGWENDLGDLLNQKKIISIIPDDTKLEQLFPNNETFNMNIFDEWKEMWKEIKIPDKATFEQEMRKANLSMGIEEKNTALRPIIKERKKPTRRSTIGRMTNVHLNPDDVAHLKIPDNLK